MKKAICLLMTLILQMSTVSSFAENEAEIAEEITAGVQENYEVQEAEEEPVMMEIYVSPNGNDSAGGDKSSPFLTLERAKQEVRKHNKNMTGNIIVNIAAGTYYMENTLTFTSEDSASNGYSVIYKGSDSENTVLSGGMKLVDWKLHDSAKNIWVADAKGLKSRQMFVNGERRSRAALTSNLPELTFGTVEGDFKVVGNNIFAGIKNITEVEIILKKSFSDWRMPIVELRGDELIMPETSRVYKLSPQQYPVMRIENAYEWLDEAGEWYLNTPEGKVYYKPKNGEELNSSDIVAARLERIFDIVGEEDSRVNGITFTGFTLKDCTWMGPNDLNYGYANFQAGFCREFDPYYGDNDYYNVDSAIHAVYADNINIERCIFKNLGGSGVWYRKSVCNSGIIGNIFNDISHNGIMLSSTFNQYMDKELCDNIKIENNIVSNVGIEYLGCVGIFAGYPANSSISYNEVFDIPYTGISLGWGWLNMWPKTAEQGDGWEGGNHNNKICGNYVHDIMTYLRDGGGIYILGINKGLEVSHNVVADIGKNEAFAYYWDNGARWTDMHDNVCYNVDVALYSKGADNEFYNNYFDGSFENSGVIGDQRLGHSEYKNLPFFEGHENKIYDNTVVRNGYFPAHIMMNAGLNYEYQDLKGLIGDETENIAVKASCSPLKSDESLGKFMTGKGFAAATDGISSTEMRASGKDNWIADIDLGAKRSLTKLRILFGSLVPEKVKLSVSANGVDYTEIPFEEINQDNEIPVDNIIARSIRLQVLEGQMAISEFEAYANDFIPVLTEADKMLNLTLVTFDDIKEHWAKSSIEYLASLGVIKGKNETIFDPEGTISRSEWISLLTRVLSIQKVPYLECYSDVVKDDWFADNVQAAVNSGLLKKSFGEANLMPQYYITRAQVAATLDTVQFEEKSAAGDGEETKEVSISDFTDVSGNAYYESIDYMLKSGIMQGESESVFNPEGNLTRAEAAVILERVWDQMVR